LDFGSIYSTCFEIDDMNFEDSSLIYDNVGNINVFFVSKNVSLDTYITSLSILEPFILGF